MTVFLLNNRIRDHKSLFGPNAFCDLDTDKPRANKAHMFHKDDYCVVLREHQKGHVVLKWYRFKGLRPAIDKVDRKPVGALFGPFIKQELMAKERAFQHPTYNNFFKVTEYFEQGRCSKSAASPHVSPT
jgi:hypothetical protein